jgi:hypothetical protein
MSIEVDTKKITQEVLIVKAKDKLTKSDYEIFVPKIEKMIENGKIRILFKLKDFDGWTTSAAWEDTKFGIKHYNDIERLAIVGEKRLEKGMAIFCKAFTTAKVKFFETKDSDKAENWIGLKNGYK